MTEFEFVNFQEKLKEVYSFKFDVEVLRDVVIDYSLEACVNAYKSIVGSSPRLSILNIISELKNELISTKPEFDRIAKYLNCIVCENTGLITMLDEEGRRYSFSCNCQKGKEKQKNLKLNIWLGKVDQFENKIQYFLES